jgi:uncharacterized protein (DUF697 family)
MTEEQKNTCHAIIHSHAVACGGGNLVPVPGVGIAADIVTMTTMTMALAGVFGSNIPKQVANGIAIAALKRTLLKQPIKTLTKELSKFIPFLGQIVGPAISITMIESAGWAIAHELEDKSKC